MGGLERRVGKWLVQQEYNICDGYRDANWAEGPHGAVCSENYLVFLLEMKETDNFDHRD